MPKLNVQEIDNGVVFTARIIPGSSKTALCGLFDGMLKIKVAAPPQKGKANQCLVEFLARQLSVKKNAVRIVSGQTTRIKRLHILGVSAETLSIKLNLNGSKSS
jgi:uncharacterized protein (TIGR00251 family)